MKSSTKKKLVSKALYITPYVFALCGCTGYLLKNINGDLFASKRYEDLKNNIEVDTNEEETNVVMENDDIVVTLPKEEIIVEPIEEDTIIEEPIEEEIITYETDLLDNGYEFKEIDFDSLKEINEDSCSWITIDGTNIDYPIVQGEDNEYYLHHDIYGKDSSSGTLYVDSNVKSLDNEELSPFTVVYGHKMKKGTMFSDLHKYKNEDFYDEHKFGVIYTPDGYAYKAEIFACYILDANNLITIDANKSDEEIFDEYINIIREGSTFESDVEVNYGDNILELVTCSYETNNSRCIVLAKLVKEYTNYNQLNNNLVK